MNAKVRVENLEFELKQHAQHALEGDSSAYRDFLALTYDLLTTKVMRAIGTDHYEDVVQDILVGIHRSLNSLDPHKPVIPWINAIARYKIADFFRHHYRTSVNTSNLDPFLDRFPDMRCHDAETQQLETQMLTILLSKLNKREAQIVIALKQRGYSVEEVAETLDMSMSNVKTICHRALKKMKQYALHEEFK